MLTRTPLETAVATVRAYAKAVSPLRVAALVDLGEGPAGAVVEWTPGGVTVTEATEGAEPEDAPETGAEPAGLPELRAVPGSSISVHLEALHIGAPIGALGHMADGVSALAAALGGRSVAAADFATADEDVVLTLAAREGEPVIAAVGDDQFQLPLE